jgi:hypothetical protein
VGEVLSLNLARWATPPHMDDTPECAVTAVCRASSRMLAVETLRSKSHVGSSSREIERHSHRRQLQLEVPAMGVGEVYVRALGADGGWERLG